MGNNPVIAKPIKFIWGREDTFETIRERLINLIGQEVINNKNGCTAFTIFKVFDVYKSHWVNYLKSLVKFTEGDVKYSTSRGDFNFGDSERIPNWSFNVHYGVTDARGFTMSNSYTFSIPRGEDYKQDIEKCRIVKDDNHPFVHYDFSKEK